MSTRTLFHHRPTKTPSLFWWITSLLVLAALVPTLWITVDIQAATLFSQTQPAIEARQWWWVEAINLYVPAIFRTVVFIALGFWIFISVRAKARSWRLPLAFFVLSGAIGPGLVVNAGFKENWQRARPYQVQEFGGAQHFTRALVMTNQCNNNCSFVSGHVACGFFLASLLLIDRKRKFFWGLSGIAAGFTIGFARMADSAHWLSDVLWAGPITLLCSWVVWKTLLLLYPPGD